MKALLSLVLLFAIVFHPAVLLAQDDTAAAPAAKTESSEALTGTNAAALADDSAEGEDLENLEDDEDWDLEDEDLKLEDEDEDAAQASDEAQSAGADAAKAAAEAAHTQNAAPPQQ